MSYVGYRGAKPAPLDTKNRKEGPIHGDQEEGSQEGQEALIAFHPRSSRRALLERAGPSGHRSASCPDAADAPRHNDRRSRPPGLRPPGVSGLARAEHLRGTRDPRIEKLARVLVHYSLKLRKGELV